MKRISMEAKIQVIQVVLGIRTWYRLSRGRPLVLGLVRGMDRGAANRGRLLRGENAMVDVKENGRENTSVRVRCIVCCNIFYPSSGCNDCAIRVLVASLNVEMMENRKVMHRWSSYYGLCLVNCSRNQCLFFGD